MAKSNHESKHNPEVKEKTSVDKAKPTDDKGWDTGTVLLGVGLITAGIVFLLGTLNVVDIYLGNIWQLWPLIIVGVGISFLHLKGAWKNSVVGLFIVASLGLLYVTITNEEGGRLVGSKDENRKQSEVTVGRKSNSVDSLDLKIETGAMKVVIDPLNGSQIAKATLDGNRRFELKADTTVSNTTQQTTISTKGSGFGWTGLSDNKLNVQITKDIPVMLRMDAGAASLDANLADIRIKEFTVDAGASSLKATIGNKEDTVKVSIDAGASSITLRVPKDSGVRVESEGGLSSKNFEDIYEVSDGVYESKEYHQAVKKITIVSDVGASSIKIERY